MAPDTSPIDQAQQFSQMRSLLMHPLIRDDLSKRRALRSLTAARHNVFDALGLGRKENYHSRFMGYLLDPTERHDQGAVFLCSFLDWLREHHGLPSSTAEGWTAGQVQGTLAPKALVTAEKDTGGSGRIDLVLELSDGTTIAIENKVDAQEQEDQLRRYWHWLRSLGKRSDQLMLVFLTPDGRADTTAGARDHIVRMSYGQLAEVLERGMARCPETAHALIATTRQYIQLCQRIAQGDPQMSPPNPEIVTFLQDTRNLEVALDLQEHLNRYVLEDIKRVFRGQVMAALQSKLDLTPAADTWLAGSRKDDDAVIGLLPKTSAPSYPGYSCVVELRFAMWKNYVGWYRPAWLRTQDGGRATAEVEAKMQANALGTTEGWWVVWKHLNDFAWAKSLQEWTPENILEIHKDNQSESHELANRLADLIWSYFDPYHKEMEVLPDFSVPARLLALHQQP